MTTKHSFRPSIEHENDKFSVPRPARAPATVPKQRHSIWLWIVGLLLMGAAAFWACWRFIPALNGSAAASSTAQSRKAPVVPVTAHAARRGDLPIYLDGVGTVQALNMVTIHTRVDGQLTQVLFEEGQFVQKDQLIATIDDAPYQVQRQQAVAQEAKDQATLDNANADLRRYEKAQDAIPTQQLDTARSTVAQLAASLQVDDATIKNAEVMIAYTKIMAPISGRMGLRNIDAGNIVHASDVNGLAVITQVQPISVVFTLAQNSLPQVQKAMKAVASSAPASGPKSASASAPVSASASAPASEPGSVPVGVTTLAYDTSLTKLLATGSLTALDNQIDVASGTFKLKSTFANDDNALFPNQFVNMRLLAETRKNVVLVPAEAIQRSPQSTFVDVINDDQTVDQRDVTVGPTEADMTIVEQGLDGDEMVATTGLDQLKPGVKVTIQSAATGAGTRSGSKSRPGGTQSSTRGGRRGAPGSAPAATSVENGGPAGEGGNQ